MIILACEAKVEQQDFTFVAGQVSRAATFVHGFPVVVSLPPFNRFFSPASLELCVMAARTFISDLTMVAQ